jgi:hypothetical protein
VAAALFMLSGLALLTLGLTLWRRARLHG